MLVCVRPNPESDRLVRAGRRMAARRGGELIVAYVETPAQPPLSAGGAADAGGRHEARRGDGRGDGVAVRRERRGGAAHLRAPAQRRAHRGRTGPCTARWRRRLRGSLVDDLVRGSAGIERAGGAGRASAGPSPWPPSAAAERLGPGRRLPGRRRSWSRLHARVLGSCSGASTTPTWSWCTCSGVAFVAARHGRLPSVLAAVLSVAAFDFFFVPPHLTFAVSDTQYVHHLRGDAGGGPPDQHARRARACAGRGGPLARAAHAGPLRDDAASWPRVRTDRRGRRQRRRASSPRCCSGPRRCCCPDGRGQLAGAARGRRARAGGGAMGVRAPAVPPAWAPTPCPGRRRSTSRCRAAQAVGGRAGRPAPRVAAAAGPGPGGPRRDVRPAGRLRAGARAAGGRGRAGPPGHGGRAPAQHAAQLRVPRPAHAAGRHHRRRQLPARAGAARRPRSSAG